MSEEITALLAAQAVALAGVGVIVLVCWLLGFRARARIESEERVRVLALSEDLPAPVSVALDAEGRAALAEIDPETVFLVKAQGDRLTTRTLPRRLVAGVKMYRPPGKGIGARLRFSDLGIEDVRLEFAGREAPAFIERLRRGARFK